MAKSQILILGGGFGGLRVARQLAGAADRAAFDVTLVDRDSHHVYTPSLYEVVGGTSPRQVCIPLADALQDANCTLVQGTVHKIHLRDRRVELTNGESLPFDHLVLGLGSVTNHYGIKGLERYAFPLKSIRDAWLLRQHLEREFADAADDSRQQAAKKLKVLVAGGGATGVELAGELAEFKRQLSRRYRVPHAWSQIELIEAGPDILQRFPEQVRKLARARLRQLDVEVSVSTPVKESRLESVVLGTSAEATETLIWTAGVTTNPLVRATRGLSFDKRGLVLVDGHLRAVGQPEVWIVGDTASTQDAGTAFTALAHGDLVATNILHVLRNQPLATYHLGRQNVVMPIGHGYAIAFINGLLLHGKLAAFIRRFIDLRYLLSVLSFGQAWHVWQARHTPCADCHAKLKDVMWTEGRIS